MIDIETVILAGGFGTRLGSLTDNIPKPMVEINGKPLIWYIMEHYDSFDLDNFIVCCGYKGHIIQDYFENFSKYNYDIKYDLYSEEKGIANNFHFKKDWRVLCANTGLSSTTGQRLSYIKKYINNDIFCVTYGDGISDIDISDLIDFHKEHGKIATVTAVKHPGRFGSLELDNFNVKCFSEKSTTEFWINGGFFVFDIRIFEYITNEMIEFSALPHLASIGELMAYKHEGMWQCMDNPHDKKILEELLI
jgi:glucose-1-phosphate cytidylyltransferase